MQQETASELSARRLVYFAAERTLMSWIRTALAAMALGFVLDRFDLFLRRSPGGSVAAGHVATHAWLGAPLVIVGAAMAAIAAGRFAWFARGYARSGSTEPGHGLYVGALFAVVVAVAGAVLTLYLLTWVG